VFLVAFPEGGFMAAGNIYDVDALSEVDIISYVILTCYSIDVVD